MPNLKTLTESEVLDCLDNDEHGTATLLVGSPMGELLAKRICHSSSDGLSYAPRMPSVKIELDESLRLDEWLIVGCADRGDG